MAITSQKSVAESGTLSNHTALICNKDHRAACYSTYLTYGTIVAHFRFSCSWLPSISTIPQRRITES